MAKKDKPEFTVPPESITKGGSYLVDPATGKVERVEHTAAGASDLSPVPPAAGGPAAPTTTATE